MVPNLEPIPLPFLGGTEHDGLRACCLESAKDAVSGVWGIDSDADRYASEKQKGACGQHENRLPQSITLSFESLGVDWRSCRF